MTDRPINAPIAEPQWLGERRGKASLQFVVEPSPALLQVIEFYDRQRRRDAVIAAVLGLVLLAWIVSSLGISWGRSEAMMQQKVQVTTSGEQGYAMGRLELVDGSQHVLVSPSGDVAKALGEGHLVPAAEIEILGPDGVAAEQRFNEGYFGQR